MMQIFGRAGRPQFDTSGEATLITSQDGLARYLNKLVREVPSGEEEKTGFSKLI